LKPIRSRNGFGRSIRSSPRACLRIDPRLGVDHDTAYRLQRDAEPLLAVVTVFVTSNYDNVLTAEVTDDAELGPHVLVRAATGVRGRLPAVFGRR
jgi:hypothetical protein